MSYNNAPEQTGSVVKIPVDFAPIYEGVLEIPSWVWDLLGTLRYAYAALAVLVFVIVARDFVKARR